MSRRHAVLCKPRREAVAEANLRNQGFDVYFPRRFGLRRRAGRWEQTPVGADARVVVLLELLDSIPQVTQRDVGSK